MGPYAFKGSQWVGFDDKEMIRRKSEYIREMGLGGGMVWALDLDDFNNRCGEGKHPLLRTIKEVLGPSKDEECSEGVKNETIKETKENMEVDNQHRQHRHRTKSKEFLQNCLLFHKLGFLSQQ